MKYKKKLAWNGQRNGAKAMATAEAKAKKVEMPFIELYKFLYIDSDCLFCPANCSCVCSSFSYWLTQRKMRETNLYNSYIFDFETIYSVHKSLL